jgi:hypothetical protein
LKLYCKDDGYLDAHVKIEVNETLVKEVDKFTYLGSEITSEGKIYGKINRKIQNISELCQIIKEMLLNQEVPKQYKVTIIKIF